MLFKILVEGTSDRPMVENLLSRRFGLVPNKDFLVISHMGKGHLPGEQENPEHDTLLYELPKTLMGLSEEDTCIVVLVDSDTEACRDLKQRILDTYENLFPRPRNMLIRIAVEETESWCIADPKAVAKAYPEADVARLQSIDPDTVCGAWERLAEALGRNPKLTGTKRKKKSWGRKISQHLKLDPPYSPSLKAFLDGLERYLP